jgi:diaminopimelate epimerase
MNAGLEFSKMTGAGNDFVVLDNRRGAIKRNPAQAARRFCDRKFSVGADGLILLEKSKRADIRMRIFNPDGSEAEMCGNGVRCLAKFAVERRITSPALSIETPAGIIRARVKGGTVKARLADPKDLRLDFDLALNGHKERVSYVDTGVPHAVVWTRTLGHLEVRRVGRIIRFHPHFSPRGANVNFVSPRGKNAIEVRTYERGVEDETLACGTGSTAAALVAAAVKGLRSPVLVHTKGGEILKVYFSKKGERFSEVHLEGAVRTTFEGRVRL